MESSSTHIEIKLPSSPAFPSNIPSPGLTGAVAPIQIGNEIKPLSSFDFIFSNQQSKN